MLSKRFPVAKNGQGVLAKKTGKDKENSGKGKENTRLHEERRREIRLRRSSLIDAQDRCSITYKIAQEKAELEKAFELVWESYVEAGLQADDNLGIRVSKYHLLPSTKVLVAVHHPELDKKKPDYEKMKEPGVVVGTLTLVLDSPMGLPMEELCSEEVAELRSGGRNLAEVIALSVNPEYRKDNVMMYLYKLMFQYAKHKGITDLTCSVTKKHIRFYRRMLLFRPLGALKEYSAANQLETQGHLLDLKRAEDEARAVYHSRHFDADLYNFFFTANKKTGRPFGEGKPWSREQLEFFILRRTQLLEKLDDETKELLRTEYKVAGGVFPF
jgi:hypothetical protein